MSKNDLLVQYNDQLLDELAKLNEDNPFANMLLTEISTGKNIVVSKILQESKIFDASWIDTLESYFPSIDKIIRNPKSSIKNINEVVASERAKKINSESIRHLAAHSEYIKEVNEKTNEVTPSKILTYYREQDLGIYENRFIKTLINRLYLFVNKRYELVKDSYESYTRNILELNSNFDAEDAEVKCKIELDIKTSIGNEKLNKKNAELVKRIENLANLISGYKVSPFMQAIAKEKEVIPPIMKTNIILKNPDFRNCYLLWLFIDRYTSLGYDVSAKEKQLPVEESYQEQLLNLIMITYVTNQANDPKRTTSYDDEDFKERILKRVRQKQKGELDINLKPEEFQLENTLITEVFLKEASKMFNNSYEEQIKAGDVPSVALKKVIRQMLDVTNAVYKSMFEIPDDNIDVFKQLMGPNKKTEEEIIKDYKRKIKILKDVISVKAADLKKTTNEMLRMEKRLNKHLEAIEKAKEKELAKQRALEEKELARKLAAEEKVRLAKEKELAKQKAKEEAKKAKELEKARLSKEKERERLKAKAAADRAKAKEKLKRQQELEKQKERLEKEKAEQLRLKLEREEAARLARLRAASDEALMKLVRETKEIARETEEISRRTEIEAGFRQATEVPEPANKVKKSKKKPITKSNSVVNEDELSQLVLETKEISNKTVEISKQAQTQADSVLEEKSKKKIA